MSALPLPPDEAERLLVRAHLHAQGLTDPDIYEPSYVPDVRRYLQKRGLLTRRTSTRRGVEMFEAWVCARCLRQDCPLEHTKPDGSPEDTPSPAAAKVA